MLTTSRTIADALPDGRRLIHPLTVIVEHDDGEVIVSEPLFHMHPEQRQHLDIRVYDLTPRFNIYIVDDNVMTVQNYAYGRGEDTPTLLLKRKMKRGLFDFYSAVAQHILEYATNIGDTAVANT